MMLFQLLLSSTRKVTIPSFCDSKVLTTKIIDVSSSFKYFTIRISPLHLYLNQKVIKTNNHPISTLESLNKQILNTFRCNNHYVKHLYLIGAVTNVMIDADGVRNSNQNVGGRYRDAMNQQFSTN